MELSEAVFSVWEVPLPPPWRKVNDGRYVNEFTGEESHRHPALRFVPSTGPLVPVAPEEDPQQTVRPYHGEVGEEGSQVTTATALTTTTTSRKGVKSWDFRCMWKELGLFGNVNSYGLTIRYYEDGESVIKFDGLDGKWHFSQLEGPYGPVDRYDLFVGAKIRVFGRHLTISATSASTCQWIDEEGKRLMKKQDWLQSKIESVGSTPVVRRNPRIGEKCDFMKKANSGNADLRRIGNENTKLQEQLAQLGMARIAAVP
jgi:hypothetical protein